MNSFLVIWLASSWNCPGFNFLVPKTLKPLVCEEERRIEVKMAPDRFGMERLVAQAGRPVRVFELNGQSIFKEKRVAEKTYVEVEP
jgi:hypothetical protein